MASITGCKVWGRRSCGRRQQAFRLQRRKAVGAGRCKSPDHRTAPHAGKGGVFTVERRQLDREKQLVTKKRILCIQPCTSSFGRQRHAVPEPNATEASAPDAEASVSTSLLARSLPKEDLGIPRRHVDRSCGPTPHQRSWISPRGGATPRRSISDYDKEEMHRAFGYFLT